MGAIFGVKPDAKKNEYAVARAIEHNGSEKQNRFGA